MGHLAVRKAIDWKANGSKVSGLRLHVVIHWLIDLLTRGTVSSTMRRAAHPSGCARCEAGAGCSAIKYQSLMHTGDGVRARVRGRAFAGA